MISCPKCGALYKDDATSCGACGAGFAVSAHEVALLGSDLPPQLSNYLLPALLATLCAFPPFGLVALVFAVQVNQSLARGDIQGAIQSARYARTWVRLAMLVVILFAAAYLALVSGLVLVGI